MKVRVEFTVDIDPEKWRDVYGSGNESLNAIRSDVRDIVRQDAIMRFSDTDVLA